MSKPIVDMSDAELQEEMLRLKSFKVPAAPVAKSPRKPKPEGSGKRKASWKDEMGMA